MDHGATNLITGIANAYFDSIPTIFITGQVNTYELKGDKKIKQNGFQETNIIDIVKSITKYCTQIKDPNDVVSELEKAYKISLEGRKGPVLLDIPMDIQRQDIDVPKIDNLITEKKKFDYEKILNQLDLYLKNSKKPLIIAGAGIDIAGMNKKFKRLTEKLKIPIVTSMIAIDVQNNDSAYNYGFIGAYGHRYANFITEKSDLIVTIGTRLSCRQVGSNRKIFAPNAKILRIDIDTNEFDNKLKEDEVQIEADISELIEKMLDDDRFEYENKFENWNKETQIIKEKLSNMDKQQGNEIIEKISEMLDENCIVTTDVGQNQVWVAQSFKVKEGQRVLFSGGHGSMGYSLPAAIGAYYASKAPIICFTGDGGLQMNIQEFQFLVANKIPVKIIVLNNYALGMIRHFQEMYFNGVYSQTIKNKGYESPNFCKIAEAYGISSVNINSINELNKIKDVLKNEEPVLIQININENTYIYPKLSVNNPIYNQDPKLDENLIKELLSI